MSFHSWLQSLLSALAPGRGQRHHRRRGSLRAPTHRPNLEVLEDRTTPAFLAPADYAVGSNPIAVVAADFNNDTVLDLAVANYQDSTVSVLLGNGDGTFQEPALNSPTGYSPRSLAVGDLNGDGNLDLATANRYDVSVLLGNGDGTFQDATGIGIGSDTLAVAVGDFNGDGLLDLGVTSNVQVFDGYGSDYYGNPYPIYHTEGAANVLLGNGGGGFSEPNTTLLDYAYHYSALALAANLNGDLYDDFVTASAEYSSVSVLLGNLSGYLQRAGDFSTGDDPWSLADVAVADVDGDLDADIVTANYNGGGGVRLGNGLGGFGAAQTYAAGSLISSVVLGDFTGDGNVDIALVDQSTDGVRVLHGGGDGSFSTPGYSAAGENPDSIVAGDFNGDGWLDAATTNIGNYAVAHSVSVLINDQFWPFPPPPLPPSVSISDTSVTEGNIGTVNATFTLTLSFASTVDVTVHYGTANGSATAGSDIMGASGSVIIPAGHISRTFTVAVIGDRIPEPTETFAVNLSSPTNAFIADGQGIGTILDNEPRISINNVTKREGRKNTTSFVFTVTLSASYDQAVTMSYRTVNGTATTGDSDYIAKTGTLTFTPGETTKTITIEVKGDSKKEANETFYLDLFFNSSNSLFTKNRGLGTILNDD